MATGNALAHRVLTRPQDADLAQDLLRSLERDPGQLLVGLTDHSSRPVPDALTRLIQRVLRAVADGETLTITTTPSEVTTSTAAAMLGVSRPTLMKLIKDGTLPSHKVGTHHRLRAVDVMEAKRARRARERAAFAALLDAEDDEV